MRALALAALPGTPGVLDVETPRPGSGELLVKVAASSVNGFDIATAAGYLEGYMEHRYPLVLGKDFAGTVAAVGEDVTDYAEGDAVFGVVMTPHVGSGSLAEYVTVSTGGSVAPVPAGLDLVTAGALGLAGSAAAESLAALGLRQGETVFVAGATGGVGAVAVQYAAACGARVIATARPGAESDFVTGLTDAEVHLVDYTGDVVAQVRAVAPDGVDAALVLAGDGGQLAALVREGGRVASTVPGIDASAVGDRNVSVTAIVTEAGSTTLRGLADDVAEGRVTVPVTASYSLEQGARAFADFAAGTVGKLSITVG